MVCVKDDLLTWTRICQIHLKEQVLKVIISIFSQEGAFPGTLGAPSFYFPVEVLWIQSWIRRITGIYLRGDQICHSWTPPVNNSRGVCVVISQPSSSANTPGVELHLQPAGSWVCLWVKIKKKRLQCIEASTENSQLENKFRPLSQKACFWGFLLPAIFSLCPSIPQMQTISRRAVTLPASGKNAHFKHLREMKRSAARALKVTGLCRWILWLRSSGFAAATDEGEGAARTRGLCVMYSGGRDGGLIRSSLGWFGPDAARRGPQKKLHYHPTLILFECFVSAKQRWVTDFS